MKLKIAIFNWSLVAIFFAFYPADTRAQKPLPLLGDNEINAVRRIIVEDYVDQIDESRLAAACVDAMMRDASVVSCQMPDVEATTTRSFQSELVNTISCIRLQHSENAGGQSYVGACIRSMVAQLDPLSKYLDTEAIRDLRKKTGADDGGVGVEIAEVNGHIVVQSASVVAYRAGIKVGDWIMKVDDTDLAGITEKDVVTRLRSQPNTNTALTVIRGEDKAPFVVTLTRTNIPIEVIQYKLLEPNYAYLRISNFEMDTVEKSVTGLEDMWRESNGQIKGLVLDLRSNPGGLLSSAVAVSGVFLPNRSLVGSTKGRSSASKTLLYAPSDQDVLNGKMEFLKRLPETVKSVPMIVMVNGDSAGASEIVAGALQDYRRAHIIGSPTAGKGTVQTFRPLSANTALKLTTSRIYRRSGQGIDATITPDILEKEPDATPERADAGEIDPKLIKAIELLRKNAR